MSDKPPDKKNERHKSRQFKNNNATHDRDSENRPHRPSRPSNTPAGPSRESSSNPNRKKKSVRITLPPTSRRSGENGAPIRHSRGSEQRKSRTPVRRSSAGIPQGSDGQRIIVFSKSRYKIYEKPRHSEFARALHVIQSGAFSQEHPRPGSSRWDDPPSLSSSYHSIDYSKKSLILDDTSGESKPNRYLNDSELPTRFRKSERERTGDLRRKYLVPPDILRKWPSVRGSQSKLIFHYQLTL